MSAPMSSAFFHQPCWNLWHDVSRVYAIVFAFSRPWAKNMKLTSKVGTAWVSVFVGGNKAFLY